MTKKSANVHFQNRERRSSQSSLPEMNGSGRSQSRSSGAKSPTRSSGNGLRQRPGVDRTDTSASGWATENDEDDKVGFVLSFLFSIWGLYGGVGVLYEFGEEVFGWVRVESVSEREQENEENEDEERIDG